MIRFQFDLATDRAHLQRWRVEVHALVEFNPDVLVIVHLFKGIIVVNTLMETELQPARHDSEYLGLKRAR